MCTGIVVGLSIGIYFIEITTDPVDLWAAPHSRSREEKNYFDSTFGPFYRTAQIFIKPRESAEFEHKTKAGTLKFGPAFKKEFLEKVFELQQTIEEIGRTESKGLENICFAPMRSSDETPQVSQCVVQSIFGYFGNDLEKFRKERQDGDFTINYLNTLDNCFM